MTAVWSSKTMPTEVVDYLSRHHVVTVSTSSFTGMPHADTVVYASDDTKIFFFAMDGTQMVRNISDSRHVSVTIDDYAPDWRKLRELQGVGRCEPAEGDEQTTARALFDAKFGAGFTLPQGTLYRTTPFELHFVDYHQSAVAAPEPTVRTFEIADAPAPIVQGPVSTSLGRRVFEAGELISQPGEQAGEYFVVLEGAVEVRSEGHGVDQIVVRVGPGELFGDQATLRGHRGIITAHALTRTVLLSVDRSAMRDLLLPPNAST